MGRAGDLLKPSRRLSVGFGAAILFGTLSTVGLHAASAANPIEVGPVQVDIYQNGGSASFPTTQPPGTYAFSDTYSNLTFNPPNNPPGSYGNSNICSHGGTTDYDGDRPFDYVDPFSCAITHVENADGKEQAGASTTLLNMTSFYAEFTTSFTVASAGTINFNSFPDDGQLIGIGADINGHQPNGTTESCSGGTAKWSYQLVECNNNNGHNANEVDFSVSFPAAGTYPVEIDYAENGSAGLVMTVEANHAPIPETTASFAWPTATVNPVTAAIFTNSGGSSTFTNPTTPPVFTAGPFGNFSFDPPNNPPATDDGAGNSNICSMGETVTYDANRPIDYVDPATCTLTPVQDTTGDQAGSGSLNAFEAELTSSLVVNGPGDVPFTTDPDDGLQVGLGRDAHGDQPTSNESCSGTTPAQSDAIVDCTDNSTHFAAEHDFLVHFPAAGTYPIEIDWAENGAADVSLNLELNHSVLPPQPGQSTPEGLPVGLVTSAAAALLAAGLMRRRAVKLQRRGA